MTTPSPFQWAAQPSALAAQLAVKVNRNPRPVPITYSKFRKAETCFQKQKPQAAQTV